MNKKLIIILMLFIAVTLQAQISPGDLTEAHADLEGISNCTKCHEIGEAVTNQKCLDCHTDIQNLINIKRGYHSSTEVQNMNCVECHSEHHGRKFEISRFDKDSFNHSLTAFELTGKHKTNDCEKCHNAKFISDPEIKSRTNTFLGLSLSCSGCHDDYHQKTLSTNCEDCHNTESFRPAPFFEHNNAAYKLTGSHINVECIECHAKGIRNNKDYQAFKGLKYSNCVDCHQDVHEGKLGNDCRSCHSTESFHKIKNEDKFDHSRTGFELIGRHNNLTCEDCHTTRFKKIVKYQNCVDCHEDYHNGELKKPGESYDCNYCHTEKGFIPSLYSIDDHNVSQFKLTGSHLAVPCIMCHKKNEHWTFKIPFNSCTDCHDNLHGNTISGKFLTASNCTDCHITDSWTIVSFDHNRTNFPLLDKHNEVGCRECHDINKSNKVSEFVFINLSRDCESCHQDPHFNQFRENGKVDCFKCHSNKDWQPVKLDHNKTKFPLQGAHAKIECEKCHIRIEMAAGVFIKYQFRNTECKSCHVNEISEE